MCVRGLCRRVSGVSERVSVCACVSERVCVCVRVWVCVRVCMRVRLWLWVCVPHMWLTVCRAIMLCCMFLGLAS